jgi:hypothetical protein
VQDMTAYALSIGYNGYTIGGEIIGGEIIGG